MTERNGKPGAESIPFFVGGKKLAFYGLCNEVAILGGSFALAKGETIFSSIAISVCGMGLLALRMAEEETWKQQLAASQEFELAEGQTSPPPTQTTVPETYQTIPHPTAPDDLWHYMPPVPSSKPSF